MCPETASSETPDSIQFCSSSRHTCAVFGFEAILWSPVAYRAGQLRVPINLENFTTTSQSSKALDARAFAQIQRTRIYLSIAEVQLERSWIVYCWKGIHIQGIPAMPKGGHALMS